MRIVIPEQILNETKECKKEFSCLKTGSGKERQSCEVLDADGKNVLFLKTQKNIDCAYQVSFGESLICTCPTHYAVHKTYGK